MRNILLALAVAMLPAAAAEPSSSQKPGKALAPGRLLPLKGAGNSCAAYGPGFVKLDGTDTCVKIGGVVGIGAGSDSGSR